MVNAETETATDDEARLHRWERRAELPLLALAVVFLVSYAVSVLDTRLGDTEEKVLDAVTLGVWAAFALDYLVRVGLARRRWHFVRTHLFDLLVLSLPLLRQLRVLRLLTVLTALEGQLRGSLRSTVTTYVVASTALIGFVAALAALDAERDAPGTTIASFGDAVWWAMTTITTVGYGDTYPVTTEGRLVAAGLMVAGIALLGTVTATLASWFVERLRTDTAESAAEDAADRAAEQADHTELVAELRTLQDRIAGLERALHRP